MENVVRTKYLVFCSCCNAPTLFFKSTKEIFKVQGAWHSPNTLPTTVHGQAVCIKTWHTPFAIERTPLSVIQGHAEQLYEFEPCYISSVPSLCSGTSPVKPKTISLVFAGISCEKSRFYAKTIIFLPILGGGVRRVRPPPPPPPPPPWIRPWGGTIHFR
jgi:hypothetical protein